MIFKKTLSIFDWVTKMLLNLLGFITAPIIYPLFYPLRKVKFVRNNKPFWYYFDDEDGDYGTQWFRDSLSYGDMLNWWDKFRVAYKWSALRNPAWNLQASLVPKPGDKILEEINHFDLTKDGINLGDSFEFAVLKYVDSDGGYSDNKGEFLSLKYSILGKTMIWYKRGGKLYWRFSFANRVSKNFWAEVHLGTTNERYTFRFKIKSKLKIFEEI